MTYPFDKRSRYRGSDQSVPLETARKIARQRDQLVEKLDKLRRKNEQLAESRQEALRQKESLEEEKAQLADRLAEAEEEIDRLAARVEQADQSDRPEDVEQPEPAVESEQKAEMVDRLTRRVASLTDDLERVRRRSGETARQARRSERMRLLAGLGDVLDSVERGLAMQPEGSSRQGLEAIHAQLLDFLGREGAELTGEVGAKMDPKFHEAVEVVDTPGFASGEIVEVARRGVLLEDGTVVMPAKVQVAA